VSIPMDKPPQKRSVAAAARPEIVVHRVGLEPARGWVGWLTTTDHKRIGVLYLVTAFGFMMLGGVEALLMRTQLRSLGTRS
jgi:cytochrome c oxidase subunit I